MDENALLPFIEEFKKDLDRHDAAIVTHRNILSGSCFALDHGRYMHLRERVSSHFQVSSMEVIVVGSAKLGFSIAPRKRYRPFGNESDIDVAIASPVLFDHLWRQTLEYHVRGGLPWPYIDRYRDCLFQGWIRPDLMPEHRSFAAKDEWFEFFRELTKSGDFGQIKITGALYRSWPHLELYQWKAVALCQAAQEGTAL